MEKPKTSTTIKNWAEDDRPREKLIAQGQRALSDAELVAIIINSGSKDETAVELARRILMASNNNLNELSRLNVNDFKKFKGMGPAKAVSLVAALELGRRKKGEETPKVTKIESSKDIFQIMHPLLSDLRHEEFWIIYLNRANKVIRHEQLSSGGIAGTIVDNKIILKNAIDLMASAVVLCHNHPSGNLKPSQADIDITKKMVQAGKILDISVLDHVIIAGNSYYSFADEGTL
jgi:DNA repair protein RadC